MGDLDSKLENNSIDLGSESNYHDFSPYPDFMSFNLENDSFDSGFLGNIFHEGRENQNIEDKSNRKTADNSIRFEIKKKKDFGRKKLNSINNDGNNSKNNQKPHDKFRDDNVMRKIKARLIDELIEKLNENLINKKYLFCNLDTILSEYLKRDYNVKLMQTTIFDILSKTNANKKYKNPNLNKILIEKIIKENIEIKVINLLNLKFIDFINEIRNDENNLYYFLEKIKIKEENNNQYENTNINEYIKKVKDIFLIYDDWFIKKTGRNKKKRNQK